MRKKVLDIGCGSGNGSYLLAKKARNVLAIDNDRATIAAAKFSFKANNLEFKSTDILDLEEDKKFDVIISLQVIEHIPEPNVYLSKIYKLLKSRGTVILSTPNKLTQSYNENPYHIKEYSEAELVSLLNKYFSKVTILGLFGDKIFNTYEAKRKRKVLRILKLDKLGIRYILPRRIKIFFFNFLIPVVRRKLITSERGKYLNITEKNFHIDRYSKEAIDLIAVCTK